MENKGVTIEAIEMENKGVTIEAIEIPGDVLMDIKDSSEIPPPIQISLQTLSDIVICNPAIREFRVLPQPPYQTWRTTNLGFVFYPINNDYKVFRIATLFQSDLKSYDSYDDPYEAYDAKCNDTEEVPPVDHKIQIYCMSTNSWKEIFAMVPKDRPCTNIGPCVSLDGVFYWLAFDFSTCVLVLHTFRMFEELFERLQFPDAFCFRLLACLCILKNSLALIQQEDDTQTCGALFDIWVMDEYRVEESWTKKYTVGPLLGHYDALGFRPNVEVFLMSCDPGQMVSYNLSTGDINEYNQICDSTAFTHLLIAKQEGEGDKSAKRSPTLLRYKRIVCHQLIALLTCSYYTVVPDIEIICRANELDEDPIALSSRYCQEFLVDMVDLQCLPPMHQPRVTDHMEEIKDMIAQRTIELVNGLLLIQESEILLTSLCGRLSNYRNCVRSCLLHISEMEKGSFGVFRTHVPLPKRLEGKSYLFH
ncbi:hypothetical protein Vadar_034593 [Vaccinium darrowii]|uniref:Uncharacterized protein n=1 Tax=Vaccinium darrowii TaxID=229202 RepID=A0ACB7YBT1_9ERIC|nr:hypothetical protein Vadar_034593 [Vaccinium darrowii]